MFEMFVSRMFASNFYLFFITYIQRSPRKERVLSSCFSHFEEERRRGIISGEGGEEKWTRRFEVVNPETRRISYDGSPWRCLITIMPEIGVVSRVVRG